MPPCPQGQHCGVVPKFQLSRYMSGKVKLIVKSGVLCSIGYPAMGLVTRSSVQGFNKIRQKATSRAREATFCIESSLPKFMGKEICMVA
jgi:hypothetical protein